MFCKNCTILYLMKQLDLFEVSILLGAGRSGAALLCLPAASSSSGGLRDPKGHRNYKDPIFWYGMVWYGIV